MAQIGGPVIITGSNTVDNRTQPGTYEVRLQAISKATGQTISQGVGNTATEAREQLRAGFIKFGWTDQDVTDLLTEYDSATEASERQARKDTGIG